MSAARRRRRCPGVRLGRVVAARRRARLVPRAVACVGVPRADGRGDRRAGRLGRRASSRPTSRRSAAGVLRGLHYHRRQLDYWIVASRPGLRRARRRPAGRGRARRPRRRRDPRARADDWVVIPAGVAHGFLALEPLELLYLVTNEFDGSDELGFAWDDPAVGVPWPRDRRDAGRPADPVRPRPLEPVARRAGRQPPRLSAGPRPSPPTGSPTARARDRSAAHRSARVPPDGSMRRPGPSRDCPRRPLDRRCRRHVIPSPSSPGARLAQVRRRRRHRRVRPARAGRAVRRRPTSDAKVVIIVGADTPQYLDDADQLYAEAIKHTSNVDQGLQPERDLVGGQGRDDRRERRDLPGPRQRLAEPVHVRPRVHDEGRLRPQRDRRRHALQPGVLRRAVHPPAPARPGRDRLPPPPVLRVRQLRAGQDAADRSPSRGSASTTTGRRSSPPAPRP